MEYQESLRIKTSVMYALLYKRGAETNYNGVPITRDAECDHYNLEHVVTRESAYCLNGQWCVLWTLVNGYEHRQCIVDAPIDIKLNSIKADAKYTYGPAINPLRWKQARELQDAMKKYASVLEFATDYKAHVTATIFQFGNTELKVSSMRFMHCKGHESAIIILEEMIDLIEQVAYACRSKQ